jgi:F-type H+-transporting ATPase subunit b
MLSSMLVMLAAETAEVAHEAKKSGLPQLNVQDFAPQLIWLAITFGLLYFIMKRVALPRVGEVIEARRDRIKSDLDAAERLKVETDQALSAYEKALADARAKATGIAKETRAKLAADTDKEKAKVEAQISSKLADAEARIAATKSSALSSVADIAADTATAVLSKITGQNFSADDVKKVLKPVTGR